jgi:hypothetical protein
VSVLILAACGPRGAAPNAAADAAGPNARRFARRAPDTLWTRAVEDSTLTQLPEWLATDGENVYVADHASGVLLALGASHGETRWVVRADSERVDGADVPLAGVRSIAARRGGGVIVVDPRRGALVAFAPDGRVTGRTPLPRVENARSVCQLPDSTFLVADAGSAGTLLRVDPSGRAAGVVALPWDDLRTRSTLVTATQLSATPNGCVAALVFGRGFALFSRDHFASPAPYVEPVPLPRVVTTRREVADGFVVSESLADHVLAAIDLTAASGEILVAFDGRTGDRAHLIDVYDAAGTYLRSHRTNRRIAALTASDSALFVLTRLRGLATVVALRRPLPTADAAPR